MNRNFDKKLTQEPYLFLSELQARWLSDKGQDHVVFDDEPGSHDCVISLRLSANPRLVEILHMPLLAELFRRLADDVSPRSLPA